MKKIIVCVILLSLFLFSSCSDKKADNETGANAFVNMSASDTTSAASPVTQESVTATENHTDTVSETPNTNTEATTQESVTTSANVTETTTMSIEEYLSNPNMPTTLHYLEDIDAAMSYTITAYNRIMYETVGAYFLFHNEDIQNRYGKIESMYGHSLGLSGTVRWPASSEEALVQYFIKGDEWDIWEVKLEKDYFSKWEIVDFYQTDVMR